MNECRYKILIDTDIGDDIDDAIALYAAMQRRMNIIGVTTVFRNTAARAMMAKKLMTVYGNGYENAPVYAGYGVPLAEQDSAQTLLQMRVPHFTQDAQNYVPSSTNPDDTVDFIIDSCKKYGKELCILAIGPFTNIARAIEKDPDALKLCGRICIMGGAYYKQYADWNVMCDVEAAELMYTSLSNLECIGADVTHLCKGDKQIYDAIVNNTGESPARRYLTEMCALWKADRPQSALLLHDPLVVYYAEDPEICDMREIQVAVIKEGFARGMTLNVDGYGKSGMNRTAYEGYPLKKCRAAYSVNLDRFFNRVLTDFK